MKSIDLLVLWLTLAGLRPKEFCVHGSYDRWRNESSDDELLMDWYGYFGGVLMSCISVNDL